MRKIAFVVLSFLFITACSEGNGDAYITYEGNSNNWKGQLQLSRDDSSMNGTYSFRLLSGEMTEVENLTLNINEGGTILKEEKTLLDQPIEPSIQCSGCLPFDEDTIIPVVIRWNGKVETFHLKAD
ncbi:hypothetical protein [Halobacillus halophilus]|uniref:hypothetical protein n=1 Tax=Halobacillus halophilus TaxID=1570 RepID=UPI001CD233B8|nr:hypothetical protein [Halobacillus halophilus]MCA1011680.1 hypothetical protein [Halobacillus halophilus]